MTVLTDNYFPTIEDDYLETQSMTVKGFYPNTGRREVLSARELSQFTTSRIRNELNIRVFKQLESMYDLRDNWDEEGSLAPKPIALIIAEIIALSIEKKGQKIHNSAPGPSGEIMLDIRNKSKSLEFLIYNGNLMKYVKFDQHGKPIQGVFTLDTFQELLNWVNS